MAQCGRRSDNVEHGLPFDSEAKEARATCVWVTEEGIGIEEAEAEGRREGGMQSQAGPECLQSRADAESSGGDCVGRAGSGNKLPNRPNRIETAVLKTAGLRFQITKTTSEIPQMKFPGDPSDLVGTQPLPRRHQPDSQSSIPALDERLIELDPVYWTAVSVDCQDGQKSKAMARIHKIHPLAQMSDGSDAWQYACGNVLIISKYIAATD